MNTLIDVFKLAFDNHTKCSDHHNRADADESEKQCILSKTLPPFKSRT
jgi:hypothetical protein